MSQRNHNEDETAPAGDVYLPLEDRGHKGPVALTKEPAVSVAAQKAVQGKAQIGAKPIHWGWWAAGLAASLGLWLVIIAGLSGWH